MELEKNLKFDRTKISATIHILRIIDSVAELYELWYVIDNREVDGSSPWLVKKNLK